MSTELIKAARRVYGRVGTRVPTGLKRRANELQRRPEYWGTGTYYQDNKAYRLRERVYQRVERLRVRCFTLVEKAITDDPRLSYNPNAKVAQRHSQPRTVPRVPISVWTSTQTFLD